MTRFLIASAMTCVFSVTVLAGDVPTVGSPQPDPTQSKITAPGEIPSVGKADALTSEALSALMTALSFLAV